MEESPILISKMSYIHNYYAMRQKKSKNIVFVGAHSPNKGYDRLIEAFKLLEGYNLYMIGSCAEKITDKLPGLHVFGYVPSLKPYLSRCSIYVHPAYFESFGISVLEAMSAGLIPIVTKQTGVSEVLVKNGLSSLVVPGNKPEMLAKKIADVQNYSLDKKKSISAKCRKIVRDDFLEERGIQKFREAFTKLC